LKFRWLDERVIQKIGETSTEYTAERFRGMYRVSPCKGWPIYRSAAHCMGIPIPSGVFEVAESSSEDESEDEQEETEEESEEEREEEERPLPPVPDAVVPFYFPGSGPGSKFGIFMKSGVEGNVALDKFRATGACGATGSNVIGAFLESGAGAAFLARVDTRNCNKRTAATAVAHPTGSLGAFLASGVDNPSDNIAIAVAVTKYVRSGAKGRDALAAYKTSNKGTAASVANGATAATDSSKKPRTCAQEKGIDNRPAWVVQMEREKLLSSSSSFFHSEADSQHQSTASRSTPSMSWGRGKPQSTASCSVPSMSWGKPKSTEPTEPTSSNKWTYRTFSNKY
jgi:hypothetical protein